MIDHHGFDCISIGLWNGQIQILNIDDQKLIGRIHTVGDCSLTELKYVFINKTPFIIAGHANGQVEWYSAKCGTITGMVNSSNR